MSSSNDSAHMARALELAARGRYAAHPNPMVGCVLGGVEAAITGTDHDHIEVETGVAHPDCCVEAVILARRRSRRRGTAAEATFNDSTAGL